LRYLIWLLATLVLWACGGKSTSNEVDARLDGGQDVAVSLVDAGPQVDSHGWELPQDMVSDSTVVDSVQDVQVADYFPADLVDLLADAPPDTKSYSDLLDGLLDVGLDLHDELLTADLQDTVADLSEDLNVVEDLQGDEWISQCPEPCPEPESVCLEAACVGGDCIDIPANDGVACDNGNLCTTEDICANGKCTPGSAVQCDDGDQCTTDSCDPGIGCVHEDPPNPCWPTPALILRFPLWGAPFSQRIARDGELLYAVAQGSLRVFHNQTVLDGGGQPQVSRVFEFGATDIEAADDFAYLAGSGTFAIIDMDEPENPLVRGTLDLSLSALHLDGHMVYGVGGGNLHVVDVTDPDAPTIEGTIADVGPVTNLAQLGTMIYLVGGGNVTIVDVANPAQPEEKSVLTLGDETYSAAMSGNVLYVGGRTAGQGTLWVLSLEDPSSPIVMSTLGVVSMSSWGIMGLTVAGDHLYAQAWKSSTNFFVWDISTPTSPTQVYSSNRPGSGGYDILVDGDLAWVTCGNAGLRAYDVKSPAQPQAVAVVSAALARSMSKIGDYLYFADSGPSYGIETGVISGLKVFDVEEIANPILKKNDGSSLKVPLEMKSDGEHLYIGDNSGGLKIIDVSVDPLNTETTVLGGSARNSTALGSGNKLYILRWPDKLETVDVTNIAAPSLVATYQQSGIVHGQGEVVWKDDYLYIANYNLPFRVFSSLDPFDLSLVGSLELGGVANAVALRDDYGWVAMNSGEIRILDLSNPALPEQVGTLPGPAGANSRRVEFGGNYAFVAHGQAGAGIYGILDPTEPELLGIIPADHQILDVEFDGTHLFLLEADNSLLAVGGF
jgi:hypothetical protein